MKNQKLFSIIIIALMIVSSTANAQWNTSGSDIYNSNIGGVSVGTAGAADPDALLEIKSTTKGILIPRMTKTQRDAIPTPITAGLLIYQTNNTPGFYYYDGSVWAAITPKAGANKTLANLTAPTAVNMELLPGTTNTLNLGSSSLAWKDLYFNGSLYLDGIQFINNNGGNSNTFAGYEAGLSNTGGSNSGFGYRALRTNTTGSYNTAVGLEALYANTAYSNTATGYASLHANSTGESNCAFGATALYVNTTGSQNTAVGLQALYLNTTGSTNIATGNYASWSNTSGNGNIAIGYNAAFSNTIGNGNVTIGNLAGYSSSAVSDLVVIGDSAGYWNSTGVSNVFIGKAAGRDNTTGGANTAAGSLSLSFNTTGEWNTAIGYSALSKNSSGYHNTALGSNALLLNTTGEFNTADGSNSMYWNTTGSYNTACGYASLFSNSTGSFNTAIGNSTLGSNSTGTENTAVGYSALLINSIGNYNTAIGSGALNSNSTASNNTAVGYNVMDGNTTGTSNTAIGSSALQANTIGSQNTVMGTEALYANTTGLYNTAVGYQSLKNNVTGSSNTSQGYQAGFSTTGTANTYYGWKAGYLNTSSGDNAIFGYDAGSSATGGENAFFGSYAGHAVTTGTRNTYIGRQADGSVTTLTNSSAIGYLASVSASNNMVFGNSSVLGWGFGVAPSARAIKVGTSSSNGNGAYLTTGGVWTDISKANTKEDIQKMDADDVLNKINELNIPRWKYIGTENEYHIGPMADEFYRLFDVGDEEGIAPMDKAGVALLGIQALSGEVEEMKSAIDLNHTSADYQKQIDALEFQNQQLSDRLIQLENMVNSLDQSLSQCCMNHQSTINNSPFDKLRAGSNTINDGAKLEQNIPNPFDGSTIIKFYIPQQISNAQITISNLSGMVLKTIDIMQSGAGQISISTGELASGTYQYSLVIDGRNIDVRQMTLTK